METAVMEVLCAVRDAGGRPLLVGGFVRDTILGVEPKDVDVEVYGLSADDLVKAITPFGAVDLVGASFGVVMLHLASMEVEFVLPRRDNKTGQGHKGFMVKVDLTMTPTEAAERRDFTMNSMFMDPFTGEIIDPFGGIVDLQADALCHTSEHFREDPLRVLRGMQFCGRFNLVGHEDTIKMCREMLTEFGSLATERVWAEWWKWATKSLTPSMGLDFLSDTDWVNLWPDLRVMKAIPQDPELHPEGSVWSHTKHAVNAAARIASRESMDDDDRATLVLAVLCHDIGKSVTTGCTVEGRIVSPDHDHLGEKMALVFMRTLGAPEWLALKVSKLTACHMRHLQCDTPRAVRKLARNVAPASIEMLAFVMECDHSARPHLVGGMPEGAHRMVALAHESVCVHQPQADLLMGRHLLALGIQPGPRMGEILRMARAAQEEGVFTDVPGAICWARTFRVGG